MANRFKNLIGKIADFLRNAYVAPVAAVRNVMKETGASLLSAVRTCRKQVLTLASNTVPVLCAAVFMTTACTVSNTVLAYEVNCGGKVIGYVTDAALCDAVALKIDKNIVAGYGKTDYIPNCKTTLGLASAGNILDETELYNAMLSQSATLTSGCGIYANGRFVAICADEATAKATVEGRLESYRNDHENCGEISMAFDIEYKNGLFPTTEIMSAEKLQLAAQNLSVMENVVETYSDDIAYNTISSNSSQYCTGITVVKTEGKNGLQEITAKVCYIDGVEVSREQLESKVITEPVDEVVVVGTKKVSVSAANKLTWPLDANVAYVVSARWGDGRGHQAVDIACEKGTAILAAKAGTVCEVGFNHPTYGHYVLIDHGNGVQTRYAHCQTVNINEGDVVTAGQVIATVGRTGRASGNHLHFEYIVNGSRVNPCPYLGL